MDTARSATSGLLGSGFDERLFRLHFENLPGPAYIWRRDADDFKLVAFNKAAAERVRTTAREFKVGVSAKALQRGTGFVDSLHRCLASGQVDAVELDYPYQSGIVRRLVITLIPIDAEHIVHHTDDITDRHLAEQALRSSEARLSALMDAHPDLLMRVTRDGLYLDAHVPAKVTQLLGLTADHFVGKRVDELFEPEFAKTHERYRCRALETGEVQKWEYTRTFNGQRRFIEARFVRSGENEVVATITDVTDRVDLERQVVNSVERERNHIGHDLHDGLGQLLTGVKLMLEPLRKKLSTEGRNDRGNLDQAIELINQAVTQTSELARGLSPVPREAGVTLNHALDRLAKRSQTFFGIDCRLDAQSELLGLSEECSNNLYRIAQEAITNAVKHGKATEVRIRSVVGQDGLALTIEDNGVGFSGAQAVSGGMGLHIMRYRARALGGEISTMNRPGGGTVVSCYCPVPRAKSAAAAAVSGI